MVSPTTQHDTTRNHTALALRPLTRRLLLGGAGVLVLAAGATVRRCAATNSRPRRNGRWRARRPPARRRRSAITWRALCSASTTFRSASSTPAGAAARQKKIVGERLARAARAVAYGENITPGGPQAVSVTRSGQDIVVRFTNTNGGLRTYSSDMANGFEVCEREVCKYAAATPEGDTVRLRGAAAAGATKVRYTLGRCAFYQPV